MQDILLIIKTPFIALFSFVVILGSVVNGSIDINVDSNSFNIGISNVTLDGDDITNYAVNKNVITFTTNYLEKIGDSSVLEYDLINKNKYDVGLSMNCTKKGSKKDYYTISDNTPEIIKSGDRSKGSITVTLVKESLTDSTDEFYCKLDVMAIQGN